MSETIHLSVEAWRDGGHWHLLVTGPDWVIKDIYEDAHGKGGNITFGNRGGDSMLLIAASWAVRHPPQGDTGPGARVDSGTRD